LPESEHSGELDHVVVMVGLPSSGAGRWRLYNGSNWVCADSMVRVGVTRGAVTDYEHVPEMFVYSNTGVSVGSTSVIPEWPRSYVGPGGTYPSGGPRPGESGVTSPVHHGRYADPGQPSMYGQQHGFYWFPPLANTTLTCTAVELTWRQDHNMIANSPETMFGYHTLSSPPVTVNYSDPEIFSGLYAVPMVKGQTKTFVLPDLAGVVNAHRSGGFGIVVGSLSSEYKYYGYGTALSVRYTWTRPVAPGWLL